MKPMGMVYIWYVVVTCGKVSGKLWCRISWYGVASWYGMVMVHCVLLCGTNNSCHHCNAIDVSHTFFLSMDAE